MGITYSISFVFADNTELKIKETTYEVSVKTIIDEHIKRVYMGDPSYRLKDMELYKYTTKIVPGYVFNGTEETEQLVGRFVVKKFDPMPKRPVETKNDQQTGTQTDNASPVPSLTNASMKPLGDMFNVINEGLQNGGNVDTNKMIGKATEFLGSLTKQLNETLPKQNETMSKQDETMPTNEQS